MMATDLIDQKAALRKTALAARRAAFVAAEASVAAATKHLLDEIGPAANRVVAGYQPIRTEIDPRPAMGALHAAGAKIGLPVIEGPGKPLGFRQWTPETALVEGPFGAHVPRDGPWLTPEILIVPLVAFDDDLNRLGYGGGYYDRTIAGLSKDNPGLRTIGFAFDDQKLPHIPTEATDRRLQAVVTERGVMRA